MGFPLTFPASTGSCAAPSPVDVPGSCPDHSENRDAVTSGQGLLPPRLGEGRGRRRRHGGRGHARRGSSGRSRVRGSPDDGAQAGIDAADQARRYRRSSFPAIAASRRHWNRTRRPRRHHRRCIEPCSPCMFRPPARRFQLKQASPQWPHSNRHVTPLPRATKQWHNSLRSRVVSADRGRQLCADSYRLSE